MSMYKNVLFFNKCIEWSLKINKVIIHSTEKQKIRKLKCKKNVALLGLIIAI